MEPWESNLFTVAAVSLSGRMRLAASCTACPALAPRSGILQRRFRSKSCVLYATESQPRSPLLYRDSSLRSKKRLLGFLRPMRPFSDVLFILDSSGSCHWDPAQSCVHSTGQSD